MLNFAKNLANSWRGDESAMDSDRTRAAVKHLQDGGPDRETLIGAKQATIETSDADRAVRDSIKDLVKTCHSTGKQLTSAKGKTPEEEEALQRIARKFEERAVVYETVLKMLTEDLEAAPMDAQETDCAMFMRAKEEASQKMQEGLGTAVSSVMNILAEKAAQPAPQAGLGPGASTPASK